MKDPQDNAQDRSQDKDYEISHLKNLEKHMNRLEDNLNKKYSSKQSTLDQEWKILKLMFEVDDVKNQLKKY